MERPVYWRTANDTLAANDALLVAMGYAPGNVSRDTLTPAGVGNSVYHAVSVWFPNDGSRQTNGTPLPQANPPVAYPDFPAAQGGYLFVNPPLTAAFPGIDDGTGRTVADVNRWQPLMVVNAVDQNGFPQGPIQGYLGAQRLEVRPFALVRENPTRPWIDPGPPPFFGAASHVAFITNVVEVIRCSSELTPDDGTGTVRSPILTSKSDAWQPGSTSSSSTPVADSTTRSNPRPGWMRLLSTRASPFGSRSTPS